MKIDRHLQLTILKSLCRVYPKNLPTNLIDGPEEDLIPTMFYLEEHGLIKVSGKSDFMEEVPSIATAGITAKGIDFLEDDGGVEAILRTNTVKFYTDDLIKLLLPKLDGLNIPTEEKNPLIAAIKKAPVDSIKALYIELINLGLDKAPNVTELINKL